MQDYAAALAFINALTGNNAASAIVDFRAIHDQRRDIPAHSYRGTLDECWHTLVHYNANGYGIFTVINELDGAGRELSNVRSIRAQFVDLDNLSAEQNYQRATVWYPAPSFAVQSSPGKYHIYWPVVPYSGNDAFSLIQRKLSQYFDGDKRVADATRVMRLPGTLHCKTDQPHLVTCWALSGYGYVSSYDQLATALAGVNVIDGGGGRHDLGEPSLAAPSLEWVQYALRETDPNSMDRAEWISFTSAVKQAAWNHATPDAIFNMWSEWCARYTKNDVGENLKQWNSIRQTEVGWPAIKRRVPAIGAAFYLGAPTVVTTTATAPIGDDAPLMPVAQLQPPTGDDRSEYLNENDQKVWFAGCVFVGRFGEILTPSGRMMNATAFNGTYGGKKFIIDRNGKLTNEPWQAATRSTLWTIPKVDHVRFVPIKPPGEIITDELGRKGVNTYKPPIVANRLGNIDPFLRHMELMLPNENDRRTLLEFLAHNAKFPGFKIPWAPVLQSAEGVGKGVLKRVCRHMVSGPYFHSPNAQELIESGSKFNAWMRAKLFILVDEIKVDERRDMIEVLKPMISETEIEIQGKGHDQDKEDNYSNWTFFSNYKDAIPINKNGRRFAVYYSAIQSETDLLRRGMDKQYFDNLYGWLDHNGGVEFVAHWLLNYPVVRGSIPMRAPQTSSTVEAMRQSRGPVEQAILDAVEDQLPGFRGGWISVLAVMKRLAALGGRQPSQKTVASILEGLGYFHVGRAPRAYGQENYNDKTQLYNVLSDADVNTFGRWQGYE